MNEIVLRLRQFFKGQGLTQEDIASKLGLSQPYVSSLLSGRVSFGKIPARKFEQTFGISASWLLTGEGDMLLSTPRSAPAVETGKTDGSCTIPQSAWDVIQLQAKSLAAKDKQIEELIRQNGEVILMLKAKIAEPPKLPSLQRDEELKDAAAG